MLVSTCCCWVCAVVAVCGLVAGSGACCAGCDVDWITCGWACTVVAVCGLVVASDARCAGCRVDWATDGWVCEVVAVCWLSVFDLALPCALALLPAGFGLDVDAL